MEANEKLSGVETYTSITVPFLVYRENTRVWTNPATEFVQEATESARKKQKVVVLPLIYGFEEFMDRETRIATLCEVDYAEFQGAKLEDGESELRVTFKPLQRCIVKKAWHRTDTDVTYSDVELLPEQKLDFENEEIQRLFIDIDEQFKKYMMHAFVSVYDIQDVRKSKTIDELIAKLDNCMEFDDFAKNKLINELDIVKRMQVLLKAVEVATYEKEAEKGEDIVLYYKEKLDKLEIASEIKKQIYKEISRLKTREETNDDRGRVINWLDRVFSFPWNTETEDNKDLQIAKEILNDSHYGMDKLKRRILDLIAVRKFATKQPPQILCLYGPPGTGKSTIAKSIAMALSKKFASISLGGMSDPMELSGMFTSYLGAKPGQIIERVTYTGSKNCLVLLDEIDKIGRFTDRGDPSAVLLELFDRNQNNMFKDCYMNIPMDLSNVFFITTANDLSTISDPLLSRLELIEIEGYSLNEKVHIVRNHMLRKILKGEFGLDDKLISISKETIEKVIEQYTFESGVRQLENIIREICRKCIASQALLADSLVPTELTIKDINILAEDFHEPEEIIALEGEIGVVNKMVVYNNGIGKIKRMEAVVTEGKGEQIISDNIIGTAKSTIKTVMGLLQYRAKEWQIPNDFFSKHDIHLHVPVHEIQTDGSSGGVADVVCVLSAIKNVAIPHTIAFTGAISLKGKIMRVGGVKEKVLAAQRSGIKIVVLPLSNKKDIEKLSSDISGDLEFKYFEEMTDVYDYFFS